MINTNEQERAPQWIYDWASTLHKSQVTVYDDCYFLYSREFAVSIPKNVSENTNTVVYRPGADGYSPDSLAAVNYVQNNQLDQVTFFTHYNESYDEVYNDALQVIGKNTSANTTSVTEMAFSCRYMDSVECMIQNIKNNPDLPPQTAVLIDGINLPYDGYSLAALNSLSEDDISLLAKNGTRLVLYEKSIDFQNQPRMVEMLSSYSEMGIDITLVVSDDDHVGQYKSAINNGLFIMTSGGEFVVDEAIESHYTVYDFENGELKETTYSSLADRFNAKTSTGETEENTQDEKEENKDYSDIVSVEYGFVRSSVDAIKAIINGFHIKDIGVITNNTGGSYTFVASNEAFNEYAKYSIEFLDKLNTTYGNILKIAECMYDQDKVLADSLGGTSPNAFLSEIFRTNLEDINDFFKTRPVIKSDLSTGGNIRITKEMIINAMSRGNVIIDSITMDIEDVRKLQQEIDSFISDSRESLKGRMWDEVRESLRYYSDICATKITYAETLLKVMNHAYKRLFDYLADYDELDTAKLPEVISRIDAARKELAELERTHGMWVDTDGDNEADYQIDNSAQIAILKEIIRMLEDWRDKLINLPSVDSSASDTITSQSSQGANNLGGSLADTDGTGNIDSNNVVTVPEGSGPISEAPNIPLGNNGGSQMAGGGNVTDGGANQSNTTTLPQGNNNIDSPSGNTAGGPAGGGNVTGGGTNQNNTTTLPQGNNNVGSSSGNTAGGSVGSGNVTGGGTNQNSNNITQGTNQNNVPNGNNGEIIIDSQGNNKVEPNNNQTVNPNNSNTVVTPPINNNATTKKDNGVLKALGKILGIGGAAAAVGGGIYATKKQIDKNNDTEDEK